MVLSVIQGEFLDILYVQCFRNRINWFISFTPKNNLPAKANCGNIKKRKALRSFASCLHSGALFKSVPRHKGLEHCGGAIFYSYLFSVCGEGAE